MSARKDMDRMLLLVQSKVDFLSKEIIFGAPIKCTLNIYFRFRNFCFRTRSAMDGWMVDLFLSSFDIMK